MMIKTSKDYSKNLKGESNLWDKAAEDELKKGSPDYSYYKQINNYAIILNNDSTPAHFSLS